MHRLRMPANFWRLKKSFPFLHSSHDSDLIHFLQFVFPASLMLSKFAFPASIRRIFHSFLAFVEADTLDVLWPFVHVSLADMVVLFIC